MTSQLNNCINNVINYISLEILSDHNIKLNDKTNISNLLSDLKYLNLINSVNDTTILNSIEELFTALVNINVDKNKIIKFISLVIINFSATSLESYSMWVFYLLIGENINHIPPPDKNNCIDEETLLFEIITKTSSSQNLLPHPQKTWDVIINHKIQTNQNIINALEQLAHFEIDNLCIDKELIQEKKVLEHVSNCLVLYFNKYEKRDIHFTDLLYKNYYYYSLYMCDNQN